MWHVKNSSLIFCVLMFGASPMLADEQPAINELPEEHVLSDGKLTSEEIKEFASMAANHIKVLTATARESVGDDLKQSGVVLPSAWMLMNDGEIKKVKLGKSGENANAKLKVLMFKAALKSLARHGKILGTAIVYAGNVENDPESRLMAIEYEHRLGVSGIQVVPYSYKQGELTLGKLSSQKKPYELFYEGKALKGSEKNSKT